MGPKALVIYGGQQLISGIVINVNFDWGGLGTLDIIDKQVDLYKYAGPGHWNDPDMLEIGNGGQTPDEYKNTFFDVGYVSCPANGWKRLAGDGQYHS